MPVPTSIADLSTTASSNSPAGSDSPTTTDDHLRAVYAFIAQLRDESAAVSVSTYGATRTGSAAANSAAFAACITANPGKLIIFPESSYSFDTKITVTADNTRLYFPSCTLNFTGTGDAIHFYCTSTATVSTFLNGCGLLGHLTVYRSTSDTAGAGVRLTQCNIFAMGNVRVDNFFGGCLQEGGQAIEYDKFTSYMSPSVYPSYVAGSYDMKFTAAPIDGGLYQSAFTSNIKSIYTGGSYKKEFGLWFAACDGITFGGGYVSASYSLLVLFKPEFSGKHVSAVSLGNVYPDAVNASTGTANCIGVLDDGFAGASIVNNIDISNCTVIGNTPGKGLYSTHPNIQTFKVDPSAFINCGGTEIDVSSGDVSADSWVGVLLPWTPVLTFATPGNLSVSYSDRSGTFLRRFDGSVDISFSVTTSAFTHTTASGNLFLTGTPIGTPSSLSTRPYGALQFNGITKAGYTSFSCDIGSGSTAIQFSASGSAVGLSDVVAADCPTGGSMVLKGFLSFPAAELG